MTFKAQISRYILICILFDHYLFFAFHNDFCLMMTRRNYTLKRTVTSR